MGPSSGSARGACCWRRISLVKATSRALWGSSIGFIWSFRWPRSSPDPTPITSRGNGGVHMEFEAVLEHIIALLQRRGRISYGAVKRRFQLDDAYLEDLKVELIEAQQLARDENGRILVWAGEPAIQPPAQANQPSHVELLRGDRHTPDA